jgi:uroporphyrinogen-III decarboxylase
MGQNKKKLYKERLKRYTTAMRNEKPDRIPIRIFAAEFANKYAGITNQEALFDYERSFAAVRKCASEFQWDAVMTNMIAVWAGLVNQLGLVYYRFPGVQLPPEFGHQYVEPPDEEGAYMRAGEYDLLIESPTEYLANIWIPRVAGPISQFGEPTTYDSNMTWLKGGIAMSMYDQAWGRANALLIEECGCVPAIAGILKAPFDILADKLRGFRQVCMDCYRQPDKVQKACEALMPHLLQNAMFTADPEKNLPVTVWLHRGTYFSDSMYERFFWPTFKEIIEELWKRGLQTLWYGEGNWGRWLKHTAQLPERSIIYHVDQEDIFEAHRVLGDRFCISGGIPNDLLALGTPDEVRSYCKKVIDGVARDGGYIMDASAIIQSDAKVENIRAMTEFTLEYGVY